MLYRTRKPLPPPMRLEFLEKRKTVVSCKLKDSHISRRNLSITFAPSDTAECNNSTERDVKCAYYIQLC